MENVRYLTIEGPPQFLDVDVLCMDGKVNDLSHESCLGGGACHALTQPLKLTGAGDGIGHRLPGIL